MAVEGVIAEELFDLISDDSTFLNDMRGELERLLTEPTAKQRLLKERALLYPEESYIDICTMGTLEQCLERPNADCYNKIHFEPLKAANTDYSLGDCSYLDTCYKAKGCKYRHYRIRYPEGYESGGVQNGGQQVTNFLSALSIPEPISRFPNMKFGYRLTHNRRCHPNGYAVIFVSWTSRFSATLP
jgi:hypothetical protein